MLRRAEIVAALLLGLTLLPPGARGHEALSLEEEFVKGVFSPSFTPPPAGTYELPPLKRVSGFVLRDDTGHRVSTQRLTAGKVSVVSFIYTACPERLGCPLASLALQSLQTRAREGGGAGRPGCPALHQLRRGTRHPSHPRQIRAAVRCRSEPVAVRHGALRAHTRRRAGELRAGSRAGLRRARPLHGSVPARAQ